MAGNLIAAHRPLLGQPAGAHACSGRCAGGGAGHIIAMRLAHCLHPPAAAPPVLAALATPVEVAAGWQFLDLAGCRHERRPLAAAVMGVEPADRAQLAAPHGPWRAAWMSPMIRAEHIDAVFEPLRDE